MDSCLEADHVPQLRPGVELVGEYQGSGLAETTYLVKKPACALMPLLTLKLRRTMIGEGAVQVLARIFEPLFTPLVVVVVLAGLIGSDAWLVRDGRRTSAFAYVLLRPMLTSQSLDEQALGPHGGVRPR